MAWTTPSTVVAGSTELTASLWNEQVRDNLNYLATPPSVQVYRSSNLTSYTANTNIAWNAEAWDTDDMYTSATSTTNIVINTAGIYIISFNGQVFGSATIGRITPRVFKNGNNFIQTESIITDSGVTGFVYMGAVHSLAENDVITARVNFTGGSNYYLSGGSVDTNSTMRLSLVWIGKTS